MKRRSDGDFKSVFDSPPQHPCLLKSTIDIELPQQSISGHVKKDRETGSSSQKSSHFSRASRRTMRELGGRRARRVMAGGEEGELGDGRSGQLRDPVREVPGSDDQAGGVDPKWR